MMTPVSLLANMRETRQVFGRMAARTSSTSACPLRGDTGTKVASAGQERSPEAGWISCEHSGLPVPHWAGQECMCGGSTAESRYIQLGGTWATTGENGALLQGEKVKHHRACRIVPSSENSSRDKFPIQTPSVPVPLTCQALPPQLLQRQADGVVLYS